MARSVAERYLVAAFAFMAAATWLGVGLQSGFMCLLVFVLALQAVRLYQRRGSRKRRARSARDRPPRHRPAPKNQRLVTPPTAAAADRSQASGHIYDGGREDFSWPVPREATG